jgi:hypothetical protein
LISFYADYDETERYKKAALLLSTKLRKWRIPHTFEQKEDQGGYKNNTLYKPSFIKNKIDELKRTVIWIDCDSNPPSPEVIYKMAICRNPFCAISEFGDWQHMLVVILKFDMEKGSLDLLDFWSTYCQLATKKNINELDHEALKHAVLPEFENKINIGYLKFKKKKIGFKSSTAVDKEVEIIQKSLIGENTRKEIVEEVKKIKLLTKVSV